MLDHLGSLSILTYRQFQVVSTSEVQCRGEIDRGEGNEEGGPKSRTMRSPKEAPEEKAQT
jgi:hypothetical protein